MSIKSFIIILILSVVITYGVSLVEGTIVGSSLNGESGWPLRFGYSSFFGGSSINYVNFVLDMFFWFVIIVIIWKISQKLLKR